ncbi:MAG: LysR substrate-binding domain-containing protein [Pseudomonadota bacterium]
MPTRLPPLNAVRVFEVCARHLNFTRAAEELAVSHSAVSKQIAALEDFVGEQLFDRSGGRITLTKEGRGLREVIAPAFEQLQRAFDEHRRERPDSKVLRVATVASFAAHALVPAYAALTAALPDFAIEVSTSDRPLDLAREAVDVAIRYGRGDWADLETRALVPGRLSAVVHPDRVSDAATMPRLQTFALDEWRYVNAASVPRGDVIRFEHFVVTIQAARAGIGVALLPSILVQALLAEGQLAQPPIPDIDWPETFHIAMHPTSRRRKDVAAFADALSSLV